MLCPCSVVDIRSSIWPRFSARPTAPGSPYPRSTCIPQPWAFALMSAAFTAAVHACRDQPVCQRFIIGARGVLMLVGVSSALHGRIFLYFFGGLPGPGLATGRRLASASTTARRGPRSSGTSRVKATPSPCCWSQSRTRRSVSPRYPCHNSRQRPPVPSCSSVVPPHASSSYSN